MYFDRGRLLVLILIVAAPLVSVESADDDQDILDADVFSQQNDQK